MSVRRRPHRDGIVRTPEVSRYDLYLVLLPVPLVVGLAWALLSAIPLAYGAGGGSLVSALLLGHGLFRDAPDQPPRRGTGRSS